MYFDLILEIYFLGYKIGSLYQHVDLILASTVIVEKSATYDWFFEEHLFPITAIEIFAFGILQIYNYVSRCEFLYIFLFVVLVSSG